MEHFIHTAEREELKPGDHIYTWRRAMIYAHHGIYMGNDMVIHFGGGQEKTGKISALISPPPPDCKECRDYRKKEMDDPEKGLEKVSISCLRCFLAGGKLKRTLYSASRFEETLKRSMTCSTATADPPEKVIERAKSLLQSQGGFGSYNVAFNNCQDFAFYCTTGNNCPQARENKIIVATEIVAGSIRAAGKAAAGAYTSARTMFKGKGPI